MTAEFINASHCLDAMCHCLQITRYQCKIQLYLSSETGSKASGLMNLCSGHNQIVSSTSIEEWNNLTCNSFEHLEKSFHDRNYTRLVQDTFSFQ